MSRRESGDTIRAPQLTGLFEGSKDDQVTDPDFYFGQTSIKLWGPLEDPTMGDRFRARIKKPQSQLSVDVVRVDGSKVFTYSEWISDARGERIAGTAEAGRHPTETLDRLILCDDLSAQDKAFLSAQLDKLRKLTRVWQSQHGVSNESAQTAA